MPRPRPVHVKTSAPGRRRPAQCGPAKAERLLEVAGRRRGVAHVQPHDLPRPDDGADGDRTGVRIGAEQVADEEVALHVVGLAGLDDEAQQQPLAQDGLVHRIECVDDLAELRQRVATGELLDDLPVGGGDRQLGTDRPRALRDEREQLDAVEPHADRTVLVDLVAVEEHRAALLGARARDAAQDRHARRVGRELGEQPVEGEGDRVGSRIVPPAPSSSGMPSTAIAPSSSCVSAWNPVALPSPRSAAHTEMARTVLDLTALADDAARAATDQLAGRHRLARPSRPSPRARAGARRTRR